MAAILDRWVPSRRLERKRQRALQESLDARFGDTHITAPTGGAWNQIGNEVDKNYSPGSLSSGAWSPGLPQERPSPESRLSLQKPVEDGPHPKDSQKHNFTITIPLPWSSRKSHTRTPSTANSTGMNSTQVEDQPDLSPSSFMSSPELTPRSFAASPDPNSKSYIPSPNSTLQSQATSPVVIYKPVSEEYKQQLAEMASGINRVDSPPSLVPDRTQNVSPTTVTYRPASDDIVKEMAEVGMGPSPAIPQRETFPRLGAPSKPSTIGLPSDPRPTPISHSPEPRIAPMGLPPDPRPPPVNCSPEPRIAPTCLPPDPRPTPVNYPPEPRIAPMGLPPDPRPTPASHSPELRLGPMGLPAQPRVGTTRSASRGPASDRAGTTRSSSRGPALDRMGTPRSSSRGPAPDRIPITRSASRGPAPDRIPTTRSASRGPLSDRSGNASTVNGRSSSRGPPPTRLPYRESVGSDSSAGSGVTSSSSPTFTSSFATIISETATTISETTTNNTPAIVSSERTHNNSVSSAADYYAAVAKEARRIASDVEDSEYEKRRVKGIEESNGKRGKKMEKEREKKWEGPQEMVPDSDELW